jgi:YggT family protein
MRGMVLALISIVDMLLSIVVWVIIGQVILSWLVAFNVLNTQSGGLRAFVEALNRLTEPLFRPIRKLLPDFGGIDFSPLVVLITIQILRKLLQGVALEVSYA